MPMKVVRLLLNGRQKLSTLLRPQCMLFTGVVHGCYARNALLLTGWRVNAKELPQFIRVFVLKLRDFVVQVPLRLNLTPTQYLDCLLFLLEVEIDDFMQFGQDELHIFRAGHELELLTNLLRKFYGKV